jgi:hypothetical protein
MAGSAGVGCRGRRRAGYAVAAEHARLYWVAVPKAMRARRSNRRLFLARRCLPARAAMQRQTKPSVYVLVTTSDRVAVGVQCPSRWHSLVNADHGDSTTSRFDTALGVRTSTPGVGYTSVVAAPCSSSLPAGSVHPSSLWIAVLHSAHSSIFSNHISQGC